MDKLRSIFASGGLNGDEYEPLAPGDSPSTPADDSESDSLVAHIEPNQSPFSHVDYGIFMLIGAAMLWSWNMFLAAAPYFQTRFRADQSVLDHSQPAITTSFTTTNLVAMALLTYRQSRASYPLRIGGALLASAVIFSALATSTSAPATPAAYLAFLLVIVVLAAWATGLLQNGAFAFAASFGHNEYIQALMAGQGVAGILPPLAQMLTYLALPPPSSGDDDDNSHRPPPSHPPLARRQSSTAALTYFLVAVAIFSTAFVAFLPLLRRQRQLVATRNRLRHQRHRNPAMEEDSTSLGLIPPRRPVRIVAFLPKISWFAGAVFINFVITMFYPVLTAKILSVHDPAGRTSSPTERSDHDVGGGIFAPGAFIPLGFFFWNLGDLCGRVLPSLPEPWGSLRGLRRRPRALFAASVARAAMLPLYGLCNLGGRGAAVGGDLFYLLVVQFPFGLTNGWVGSSAMMTAGDWVDGPEEREAVAGFMGLCLVAGLAAGSVLSFSAARV